MSPDRIVETWEGLSPTRGVVRCGIVTKPVARLRVNGGQPVEVECDEQPDGSLVFEMPDLGPLTTGDTITIESVVEIACGSPPMSVDVSG